MHEIQELVRRELAHAMVAAAYERKLSLQADAIAFASSPLLFAVAMPIAGVEDIDFKAMLEGGAALESKPVMFWHLSGPVLRERAAPWCEGFYTVVAHSQRGAVALTDGAGQIVAQGNLGICVGPGAAPAGVIAKTKVSGGIDSTHASLWPPHVKVCGHVKIQRNGVTITVKGCIEAGF